VIPVDRLPADTPEPLRTLLTEACALPEWQAACRAADLETLKAADLALSGWLTVKVARQRIQARITEIKPKTAPAPDAVTNTPRPGPPAAATKASPKTPKSKRAGAKKETDRLPEPLLLALPLT